MTSLAVWLKYSPADKNPADRLGCLAHIAQHHERNIDRFKAGLWGATLRREIEELARTTGKVFTVELTAGIRPPDGVIDVWEAQWEASRAALRASNVDRHAREVRDMDPELSQNLHRGSGMEPFEREARAALSRAESLCTKSVRLHRKALTRSSAMSRPQGQRSKRGSRRTVRSSARSGDSGESEGDFDPPGLQTPPARGEITEKTCLAIGCEESMADKAPQARFCSERCRKRDERARQARDRAAAAAADRLLRATPDDVVDPDDVNPEIREVFDEETVGRCVRDWKRKHVPFQMAMAA